MICGFGSGRLGPAKYWSRTLADQFPGRLPADPEPALRVGKDRGRARIEPGFHFVLGRV